MLYVPVQITGPSPPLTLCLQQTCLVTSFSKTSCDLTDTTCICYDPKYNAAVEECVLQACTPKLALTTKNITATSCHLPIRSKGESTRVSNLVLSAVTAFFALSRVIYKAVFAGNTLEWDDYSILITLIAGVPSVISRKPFGTPS